MIGFHQDLKKVTTIIHSIQVFENLLKLNKIWSLLRVPLQHY